MSANQELIEKAITTANINTTNGGELLPEQQDRFVALIRRYANLLSMVRFIRMTRPSMDIDKLHIGEPVTVKASEDTTSSDSYAPKFNKITLTATKVRTDWGMTTETLQANIEQSAFEATLMRGITERMATDFELLGIQGDDSLSATTPLNKLLMTMDGWALKSDSAHIVDVGGGNISKAVFATMRRTLPKEFRADAGLRFFVADDIAIDWQDSLSDRATALGDKALGEGASGLAPYGVPLVIANLIPDTLTVSNLAAASSAFVLGTQFGPFAFTPGVTTDLQITVDGVWSPQTTVTLVSSTDNHTTLDAVEVAQKINAALVAVSATLGNVARVTNEGRILLVSPTAGAASTIAIGEGVIESPTGGDALDILGFTAGTTTGAAAGSGTSPDGSFLWLGNPRNLIWAVLDGTRIYTEFNRTSDRIEATIYNQVACEIENLNALVKATNVRKKSAF